MAVPSPEFLSALIRHPLIVSPDTTVLDAIAQMSGIGFPNRTENVQSSCVLVVDQGQLVGILTERDVVCLSAQRQPLDQLPLQQVMTHPVITVCPAALLELSAVIDLLQRHQIRHLPVLDEQQRVVGVVTYDRLQALTQTQLQAELQKHQQTKLQRQESRKRYTDISAAKQEEAVRQQTESDRNHTEVQRQQTKENEAAGVANHTKSVFLTNMSHELRAPLNVILGFTDLMLRDSNLVSTQQENLKAIHASGEHLLRLIDDLVDLAKIEAGNLNLDPQPTDFCDCLYNVKRMLEQRAIQKGLTLTVDLDLNLPSYVIIDRQKLQQVLLHLVGNAIKFTKQGSVTLRVTIGQQENIGLGQTGTDDQTTGNTVSSSTHSATLPSCSSLPIHFQIIDTGVGIPADELESIFDAFIQTGGERKSKTGKGLGLAISQRLVQLMGGHLSVTSTVGQGSMFEFILPIQPTPQPVNPTIFSRTVVNGLAPNQPQYRILVVDDQTVNRKLLVKLLEPLGFIVDEAKDGATAIAHWQQHHPDLIWMDMQMPGINGYEATRMIRAMEQDGDQRTTPTPPSNRSHTIIIALTAEASVEDRDRALAIGCDDYLSKPFRVDQLLEKLAEQLGVQYTDANSNSVPATQPGDQSTRLTAESLAVMPRAWVVSLYNAALTCNERLVFPLLQQIPAEQTVLATQLEHLASNFEFEQILNVAKPYIT